VYDELNQPVIGLAQTAEEDIHRYGCVAGSWESPGRILSIRLIAEKPSLSFAKEFLRVDGLASSEYLSVFGLYIIDSDLVAILRNKALKKELTAGELQLTDALEEYRGEKGLVGVKIRGTKNDIGLPSSIGV
jgi:UTP--glucose-1-phosphate uridylyltransferase